jgi:hypothetical protein
VLIALGAAVLAARGTSAQGPGPSAGTVLVSGLLQPKGLTIGPDGMIYIAESGTGGDQAFTAPDGSQYKNGLTGRISKVNPNTGVRTTVADGLPSNGSAGETGEAVGPADVAFVGSTLYYLQTHGGTDWGFDADTPTGIYRVNQNDGSVTLIADLGAYNHDHPTEAITSGTQQDIEPGGNPYAMKVRNSNFYVTDGNHNHFLRVTTSGQITNITEFPNHPVSTGLDFGPNGAAFVSYLGQGPFFPEDGKVVSVNVGTGDITEVASGQSWMTDVEFGPGGKLYGLQFNDEPALSDDAIGPFKGTILTVDEATHTMSPLVTGLSFPTFLVFDGDTAYVSNFSVTPDGQIVKIPNFSSVRPPAATPTSMPTAATTPGAGPTATPRGGTIAAPNTGDGNSASVNGSGGSWLVLLAIAGVGGVALTVVGVRSRRAR